MCPCTYTHTHKHIINTYISLSHREKKKKKPPGSQLWDQTRMRIMAIQEETGGGVEWHSLLTPVGRGVAREACATFARIGRWYCLVR